MEEPRVYVTIDASASATLYLPPEDAAHARSEGRGPEDNPEGWGRRSGVERIAPASELGRDLADAAVIYTLLLPGEGRQACRDTLRAAVRGIAEDACDRQPNRAEAFLATLRDWAPGADLRDLAPWLDACRLIKR